MKMVFRWTFTTNQQPRKRICPSHPNHYKQKLSSCLARRICATAEKNAGKLRKFENLKSNLPKGIISPAAGPAKTEGDLS